jgi:hypothetical protein
MYTFMWLSINSYIDKKYTVSGCSISKVIVEKLNEGIIEFILIIHSTYSKSPPFKWGSHNVEIQAKVYLRFSIDYLNYYYTAGTRGKLEWRK